MTQLKQAFILIFEEEKITLEIASILANKWDFSNTRTNFILQMFQFFPVVFKRSRYRNSKTKEKHLSFIYLFFRKPVDKISICEMYKREEICNCSKAWMWKGFLFGYRFSTFYSLKYEDIIVEWTVQRCPTRRPRRPLKVPLVIPGMFPVTNFKKFVLKDNFFLIFNFYLFIFNFFF